MDRQFTLNYLGRNGKSTPTDPVNLRRGTATTKGVLDLRAHGLPVVEKLLEEAEPGRSPWSLLDLLDAMVTYDMFRFDFLRPVDDHPRFLHVQGLRSLS